MKYRIDKTFHNHPQDSGTIPDEDMHNYPYQLLTSGFYGDLSYIKELKQ